VLERFRVTFDYVRGALELEEVSPPAPASEYDRSGTWLSRDGTTIRVDDVVPGGPAAQAGIVRGDRIVAVDGTAAESVDLPELRRRLTLPQAARMRFAIVRDGRSFTADLTPRKLV
jgi:C-terminal processing protease CtpA/Prc